jgi:hypothetical protein
VGDSGTPGFGEAGTAISGGNGGTESGPGAPNAAFGGGGGGGGFGGGGGGGAFSLGAGGGGGGGASFAIASAQGVQFHDGVVTGDGQVTITSLACP